ncbi:MAG: hypothetical protein C0601_01330 [Candidatus Muiribacterium halophilum]|uniref:VCBS repeat-containing protein n=1 Tax=Muiribacterium halophilum TaxID=2053465 RepID=A0A2N5ZLF0_MUIH1|nr:MAG: hypothetical protein C0601_01330 [Candidatus Muirbacterium halophilum]
MKRWLCLVFAFFVVVYAFSQDVSTPVNFISSTCPLSADLDGDGEKEIVFAGDNGTLHLFESNGIEIINGKWPRHISGPVQEKVESVHIVGKDPAVVVSTYDGDVYSLDLMGNILWEFKTGKLNEIVHILGAPCIDSVNNKIMVANTIGEVFVLDDEGKTLLQDRTGYSISTTPLMTDMNGDGHKDYLFKSDQGEVYVYDGLQTSEEEDFSVMPGFPVKIKENYNPLPYPMTVSDTDLDGKKEVILATNKYKDNFYIYGIENDGKLKFKIKNNSKVYNNIKCYDVDRDGFKDLVFTDLDGNLNVINIQGENLEGFPVNIGKKVKGSPKVIDVDGDGICEIVVLVSDAEFSILGQDYDLKIYSSKGKMLSEKALGKISSEVLFNDIEGDGKMELTYSGDGFLKIKRLDIFDPIQIELIGEEYEY